MKNFIAFSIGWLIAAVLMIPHARAATTLTPVISGYSSATGRYAASAASFSMTAANDGYIAQSIINVGGKAITMPATLRMAANAGQIALSGMRLTPLGVAGTLAAGWLLDQGFEYLNGQWMVQGAVAGAPYTYGGVDAWPATTAGDYCGCDPQPSAACNGVYSTASPNFGPVWGCTCGALSTWLSHDLGGGCAVAKTAASQPATEADWAALPDPLPAVAPELPYAPYLPEGVPVAQPEFSPADVPIGQPYTRPDGSTAQSRAKISPAGDGQVTIDTYDQPLTNPDGSPVANPTPQDTTEPSPDPCAEHPDRIGCADFGTPPAPDSLSTLEVPVNPTVTPIGGAGSCPADVTTSHFGITWSYQPICDFADAIRPLIIGFAWLAFAYIVAGTVRT